MTKKLKLILITLCLICTFGFNVNAASKLKTPEVTLLTVASSGKIKVTWKSIKGAKSYQVYRSTNGKNWSKLMTTSKTSTTHTSAIVGKKYYYKVRAIASNSTYNSNYSKVTSKVCKLPRTTISLANNTSTGKIKITWNKIEGASSYKVYYSTNNKDWKVLKSMTGTSLTHSSAVAGTKYYYKVRAIHSKSEANSVCSTVKYKTCKLAKPTISLSTIELTGKTKISWKKIDGVKSYKVLGSRNNKDWTYLKTTTDLSYTHNSGVVGTKYYYKVIATHTNSAANSEYSVTKYRTCKAPSKKTETMYVARPTLTVYKEPTGESESVLIPYMAEVGFGAPVHIFTSGSWHKIIYNNNLYYIWMEAEGNNKLTDKKSSFKYETSTQYQKEVVDLTVDIALNWNTVYVHDQSKGEMNPDGTYGFDCSGFASYVLNTVMQKRIPTYRLTASVKKLPELTDIYNGGYKGEFCKKTIKLEDIQPGDIIFFNQKSLNDHCGIYLGNGEFAHSTHTFNGVDITHLSGYNLERMCGIYRYLPTTITPANQVKELAVGCSIYSKRENADSKFGSLKKGDKVTVLYTGNSDPSYNQAYVKTSDGTKGFVYIKNFK